MDSDRFAAGDSDSSPDEATDSKHTVSRILVTKGMFDVMVSVVAAHSRRDAKFKTYRQVIIEGLDVLIRSSVFERFICLKPYKREHHRGPLAFFIRFATEEWKLVIETRALLQEQSTIKLTTQDVIVLAILAAARVAGEQV